MKHSVTDDLRRVRLRTTAVATLAVVVVLLIAGYALVDSFERHLMHQVDSRLVDMSDRVGQLATSPRPLPRMDTPDDLIQVLDHRGAVVFSSTTLEGEPPLWSPEDGERRPRTSRTDGDGDLRVISVSFDDGWIVLADSLEPMQAAVTSLEHAMFVGLPLLALVLAFLLWAVVGRTLRPVAAAVEREEQLVGDVSHELRSPLAGLRVLLETEPVEPQEVELSRIQAITTLSRLESITEQLLVFSRNGRRRGAAGSSPVDLDEIVLDQIQSVAARRPVRIEARDVWPGQVLGRGEELASLVDNLLENAVRHARHVVAVSMLEEAGTVVLAVDDDGPGIGPDDRARIFERFTRLDEARSRDRGGAGLGLAIVKAIVEGHGGTIAVGDSTFGGARFLVRLPASTRTDTTVVQGQGVRGDDVPAGA